MKRGIRNIQRLLLLILAVALTGVPVLSGHAQGEQKTADQSSEDIVFQDFSNHEPYFYSMANKWEQNKVPVGTKEINIEAKAFSAKSDDSGVSVGSYQGENNVLLWSKPKGWVEYEVNADQEGIYELVTDYFPYTSSDGGHRQSVWMSVQINGEFQYREAHSISLERQFADVKPVRYDDDV